MNAYERLNPRKLYLIYKEVGMQVIIEHSADASPYLRQYLDKIEPLGINYKALEIEKKHLPWLSEITHSIEPNFTIELCRNVDALLIKELANCPHMILATIGVKQQEEHANLFYHMTEYTCQIASYNKLDDRCLWISCYSPNDKMTALDYIKCIAYLKNLTIEMHRPILIYSNIFIPDENYRYRSLTYKIINHYLENVSGGMIINYTQEDISKHYIPMVDSFEPYIDHGIYLREDLSHSLIKALPFLKNASEDTNWFKHMYNQYRQASALFQNDFFYNSISPDEEIYAFLDTGNYKDPEYYETLGLKTTRLIGDYSMLYAKKSQFDTLSNVLRADVTPGHRIPILSHVPCERNQDYQPAPYSLTDKNLSYKGKGTYIGLIATDDIDYTNEALRHQDGNTRIACIWQQTNADDGVYYLKDQINAALVSPNPSEIISLPQEESMSTMMLGIAGGESFGTAYRGIATEAEFIVAKLKPASESLQRIYGGVPSKYGVTLQDVMVGVIKLMNFAGERNIPLVLCMPFNTNLDPHDGSLILYDILVLVARRAGVTLIIPTGEEANKRHHYGFRASEGFTPVTLYVPRQDQNMVGVIYQKIASISTAFLYPPPNIVADPVNLRQAGVTDVFGTNVYSNGEELDFLNGAKRIFFRIENPHIGEWRLQGSLEAGQLSQINLWISQQELNPYITLNPSSTFTTLGSSACIDNAMVVGGYNQQLKVMLGSSGRGYTWDERVRPLLVTYGSQITAPCGQGEWVSITGTLPAVSIMAGVAATIYSKFIQEKRVPLPNTLAINNILLNVIQQSQGVLYPNPNEGYGLFDLNSLDVLLNMSI
ncbi:MAG: hypothetical protein K0R69_784 [Clostridia bacterium]|nr:hypothetical protein [Clostridia bacterium]